MTSQESGAHPPEPVCFEGTDVPLLTVDGDKWLSLILPVTIELNGGLVDDLNHQAELSLGGRAAMIEAAPFNETAIIYRTAQAVSRTAVDRFRELMGTKEPTSPFYSEAGLTKPLRIIEVTRLFATYVSDPQENLSQVVERALRSRIYEGRSKAIEYKIKLIEEAGIDVGRVIVSSITTLAVSHKDPKRFLTIARKAGTSRSDRNASPWRSKPVARPVTESPEQLKLGQQERYAKLAEVTGWTPRDLTDNFPEIQELDPPVFQKLFEGLDAIVDAGKPVMPRDILRLMSDPKPHNDD